MNVYIPAVWGTIPARVRRMWIFMALTGVSATEVRRSERGEIEALTPLWWKALTGRAVFSTQIIVRIN